MYACSYKWESDWMGIDYSEKELSGLKRNVRTYTLREGIVLNEGLHLTGGEPFLNYTLFREAVALTRELKISSTFVETNCFWCSDDREVEDLLLDLWSLGLK